MTRHPGRSVRLAARVAGPAWAASVALVGPPLAAAQTATRQVPLADMRMASTPAARQTLQYLASCALDAGTVLTARHEGVDHAFPGSIGLAPEWHGRAMTEDEQRWVSACMLSRTNYFGTPVAISMRLGFASRAEGLQDRGNDHTAFTEEEGSFFGNLFAARPVAYVCSPPHSEAARALFAAQHRICALPAATHEGKAVTACGIVHVGECTPAAYVQDGVQYRQAITVFLPSRAPDRSGEPAASR